MINRKWFVLFVLAPALVALFFFAPKDTVGASPLPQMTPGTDPMSIPTLEAPAPQPGDALTSPSVASGQMTCPMMGGSMTASGIMPGQTGMPGMSGMSGMGMQGMNMQGMGMPGMGVQSMGNMPMGGVQNVNDVLSNLSWGNWYYTLNPWWVFGWVVVFGLMLGLLGVFVAAIIWLSRRPGKDKPAAAG